MIEHICGIKQKKNIYKVIHTDLFDEYDDDNDSFCCVKYQLMILVVAVIIIYNLMIYDLVCFHLEHRHLLPFIYK